jgi:hypothetical protein
MVNTSLDARLVDAQMQFCRHTSVPAQGAVLRARWQPQQATFGFRIGKLKVKLAGDSIFQD